MQLQFTFALRSANKVPQVPRQSLSRASVVADAPTAIGIVVVELCELPHNILAQHFQSLSAATNLIRFLAKRLCLLSGGSQVLLLNLELFPLNLELLLLSCVHYLVPSLTVQFSVLTQTVAGIRH